MEKNLGVSLDDYDTLIDQEEAKRIIEKEIIEDEAEDEEDERDTTLIVS